MRERSIHEQFEWRVCNFYEGNFYESSKKKYYDTNEGTFEGTRYEGTKLLRVKKITTKVRRYEGTKLLRRYWILPSYNTFVVRKITTFVQNYTYKIAKTKKPKCGVRFLRF